MSHAASPFAALGRRSVEQLLDSSPELGLALHRFERDRTTRFCKDHRNLDAASQSTWRLHAALVHLMLQPLVESYKRACLVASAALCTNNSGELELAFRGDARDSFVWLQCLMAEERQWCTTISCPACCAIHVLASESTIRTVITAALLSDRSHTETNTPNFMPILDSLEIAISDDSFWTPMHYPYLLAPSEIVADGLYDLRQQCVELTILVTSPPGSSSSTISEDSFSHPYYRIDGTTPSLLIRQPAATLIPLKPGFIAQRQVELEAEHMHHMADLIRYYGTLERANETTNRLARHKSHTKLSDRR